MEAKACCDLQADINGEETFLVDKKIISSYSGRLRKLFGKSADLAGNLKVIFREFPGGSESFELVSRFCYNSGHMEITPYNVSILHSAAHFMEMNGSVSGTDENLIEQTRKLLDEIMHWTWAELLVAIKQCQELLPSSSVSAVLENGLDSLIRRLISASELSPSSSISSSDSSGCHLSSDTKSTESLRNGVFSQSTWWFEDLLFVSPSLLEMIIKAMISHKLDHVIISRFLFYYQKSKFQVVSSSKEKGKIMEAVIDSLYMLERSSISYKSLFGILRVKSGLHISKSIRIKLEGMIGSQMHQANLDNLLFPSPDASNYLYDVNLVLRFVKAFLQGGTSSVSKQLKKVSRLLDLYIAEVAPDPCLKPSKFIALISCLPDSARDSYDETYRSMDMYLGVHSELSEEDKLKLCGALNYEKISPETHEHLYQNTKFPSKTAIQDLILRQRKQKSLLQATNKGMLRDEESDRVAICTRDPVTHSEWLRVHLEGMQCRVMELEKTCQIMQTQMTRILKLKTSNNRSVRSLPKLCS